MATHAFLPTESLPRCSYRNDLFMDLRIERQQNSRLSCYAPLCLGGLLLGHRAGQRRGAAAQRSARLTPRRAGKSTDHRSLLAGATGAPSFKAAERMEEAMLRLGQEMRQALENNDLDRAACAQREMREMHLERPSTSCRLLIREDCRAAAALLKAGPAVDVDVRIKAVRKLGRWLRWRRASAKDLVPTPMALSGLLCALRSEPEVAWTAQCALFHAARCADADVQGVRMTPRGTLSKLLLNEPSSFPFCLPQVGLGAVEMYDRAFRTTMVRDFISQLRALTLKDPGYGENPEFIDNGRLLAFAKYLGRNLGSLQSLELESFEDAATVLFLPHLHLPNLRSLSLVGACQLEASQRAIITTVRRHGFYLEELVLNVWTDFLYDCEDPLVDLPVLPHVRKLAVRVAPAMGWKDFARKFPSLEELTLLYHQDFAINVADMTESEIELFDGSGPQICQHIDLLYRDVVHFAEDFHWKRGLRRLESCCKNLKVLRFAVADTSRGYDSTPPEEQHAITWVRESVFDYFHRDEARCNETRRALERSSWPVGTIARTTEFGYLTEDELMAASASVMLQVIRLFDDPSLEVSIGWRFR